MPLRAKVTSIVCQVQICRGSHAPEGKGDLLCKVKRFVFRRRVCEWSVNRGVNHDTGTNHCRLGWVTVGNVLGQRST